MRKISKQKGGPAHERAMARPKGPSKSKLFAGAIFLLIVSVYAPKFVNEAQRRSGATRDNRPSNSAASKSEITSTILKERVGINPFAPKTNAVTPPTTLAELLSLSPDQIDTLDLGLIDLLCADGLHGSENLDVQECLEILDKWTRHIERETSRNFHRFQENPGAFNNSLGFYRMSMLATVLQQDFGIGYHPKYKALIEKQDQAGKDFDDQHLDLFHEDSKNTFIHGLLKNDRLGTCASLPVLYAAIAQRLGYPVDIAGAKNHFYLRYELEEGGHLNVEATARGFVTLPDSEYQRGVFGVTAEQKEAYQYLKPLRTSEWLGQILLTRSGVLHSMAKFADEATTITKATKYLPATPLMKTQLANTERRARFYHDRQEWETLWREIENVHVSGSPRAIYFENRKIQIHYFMSANTNLAGIRQAVMDLESELKQDIREAAVSRDSGSIITPPLDNNRDKQYQFLRLTTKSGQTVRIPTEALPPPLNRGTFTAGYSERLLKSGLEDRQLIVDDFWSYYKEINTRWREHAALLPRNPLPSTSPETNLRIWTASGKEVTIPKEWLPPDFRDYESLPPELRTRLVTAGDDERMLEAEFRAYEAEQVGRRP